MEVLTKISLNMHKTVVFKIIVLLSAVLGQGPPGSPQGPGFAPPAPAQGLSLPSPPSIESDRVVGEKKEQNEQLEAAPVKETPPVAPIAALLSPKPAPGAAVGVAPAPLAAMPDLNSARVTGEKKLTSDIQQKLAEDEELAKLLRPDSVMEEEAAHEVYKPFHGNANLDLDDLLKNDPVKERTNNLLDSERVVGEKKDTLGYELQASQVKEAALDDKLGIELKSIVQQIQDMQREVAEALKEGDD